MALMTACRKIFAFLAPGVLPALWIIYLVPSSIRSQQGNPYYPQDTIAPIIAPFEMPDMKRPVIPSAKFDIRDYGALEGGLMKNTAVIQKAIDKAEEAGGGTVLIPRGKWLTGALHLGNHINLYISRDAELLFSQDFNDYLPVVFSRHEDIECFKYSAFLYAEGKHDIAITGEGVLNGQGRPWWDLKESGKDAEKRLAEMASRDVPVKDRVFDGSPGRQLRPAFFQPVRCQNVLVEGVSFLYGAFWTITPTYCDNVIIRKVHITTEGPDGHTPNGDGVDPSSCRNVLIENCDFDTGDDCVAIKSGRDRDGLLVGVASENIVVRYCRGARGHGGIVIGSETSGGIRNVYAFDCRFNGTDRIVRIKTARGRGGVIENMWFRDIEGKGITSEAIHLNMLYTGTRLPAQQVSEGTPRIRNVHFKNISCASGKSYAIEMLGLPEMQIENVELEGIHMNTAKGMNLSDVRGIKISYSTIGAGSVTPCTITDGQEIALDSVAFTGASDTLLVVAGANSRGITLRKTSVASIEKSVVFGTGASRESVLLEE